jgi:chlorobactene lauroyltransferase
MLTAQKKYWFDRIFSVYNQNLIKRRFHSLKVENLNNLKQKDKRVPLVVYLNHSSWWDGLIFYHLGKIASLDQFVMMEEKQLKNLQLFRKLGAFSVVRENPREAVKSINYAVNLLKEKTDRTLWIFPQGEIKPNDSRPLYFFHGISRIIEKLGHCRVLPVALRYEFLSEFKPEVFVKVGEIQKFQMNKDFDSKEMTKNLELKLTKLLDNLRNDIAAQNTGSYENIVK